MTQQFIHPLLGKIQGYQATYDLIQFRGLPYARIPRRFARSIPLDYPPLSQSLDRPYDATEYGSCSIQPLDSVELDIRWNQLPDHPRREQSQSEDCLRITLTCPASATANTVAHLPVIAFIHGGALVIGSGERQYYDPLTFCTNANNISKPVIFASIDYRLGALGFLHCPEVADRLPANNGLYDQILALEWLQTYIEGFGGDPDNITAIGQSAGAASLSLHNSRFRIRPLYHKAINLSGSTTVLVTMTPEEHQTEFLYQAKKLGVEVSGRSITDIARAVIGAPIDAIRSLEYCGAPCSPSELIPEAEWATMVHARRTKPNTWLKSQVLCSSTYDGSISHLIAKGQERTKLSKVFMAICHAKLQNPQSLMKIYHILEEDDDDAALEKICQVVTDIGFYGAAINSLFGASKSDETKSHMVLFDIGNPFTKILEKGRFATHTWDIVSLLGAYDDMMPENCHPGVFEWRRLVLNYCHSGELPCEAWRPTAQSGLSIQKDGIKHLDHKSLANSRAQKLLDLAEQEGGEKGFDLLWENIVRFFLKTGNPRYSHEAEDMMERYDSREARSMDEGES